MAAIEEIYHRRRLKGFRDDDDVPGLNDRIARDLECEEFWRQFSRDARNDPPIYLTLPRSF